MKKWFALSKLKGARNKYARDFFSSQTAADFEKNGIEQRPRQACMKDFVMRAKSYSLPPMPSFSNHPDESRLASAAVAVD